MVRSLQEGALPSALHWSAGTADGSRARWSLGMGPSRGAPQQQGWVLSVPNPLGAGRVEECLLPPAPHTAAFREQHKSFAPLRTT